MDNVMELEVGEIAGKRCYLMLGSLFTLARGLNPLSFVFLHGS
jgi:hypothetical protein